MHRVVPTMDVHEPGERLKLRNLELLHVYIFVNIQLVGGRGGGYTPRRIGPVCLGPGLNEN
jgi:hypothetical protein